MKPYKLLRGVFIFPITMLFFACTTSRVLDSKEDNSQQKAEMIEDLMGSKNYDFIAQYALPATGRAMYLTSLYDVQFSRDTVLSNLPFYGRAYVATMNPSDAGIRFTSTEFEYQITEKNKKGWDVTILPKDTRDVRQMYLNVSPQGSASLRVMSNNRQAMNFTGYITNRSKPN